MEAVAHAAAQNIAIHGGPSRIASQAFTSPPQASDKFGDVSQLSGLHTRVEIALIIVILAWRHTAIHQSHSANSSNYVLRTNTVGS